MVFKFADFRSQPRPFDLRCDLGATMRSFAGAPSKKITGITLVQWQEMSGNSTSILKFRIIKCIWPGTRADYLDTPIPSASADAAYALESCCHSLGEDKGLFLEELHRMLKPGGRFVIVDGFTKRPPQSFSPLFHFAWTASAKAGPCRAFPPSSPSSKNWKALVFQTSKQQIFHGG
ncbi:MAG: methyltransferase domain-containing protein [Saprospiraceae bacterium]|nr:methyltransferase domain-containing protein [Saprospiraceae bacterium]